MRRFPYLLPVALVVGLLALVLWFPFPKPRPLRWEYRSVHEAESPDVQAEMDRLGGEGWEAYAYSATPPSNLGTWQLKRRR